MSEHRVLSSHLLGCQGQTGVEKWRGLGEHCASPALRQHVKVRKPCECFAQIEAISRNTILEVGRPVRFLTVILLVFVLKMKGDQG